MKAAAARPTERSRRATVSAAAVLVLLAGNALLLRSALGAEPAVATDTPAATIESLHRGLVALSRDRPTASLQERYDALEPLIAKTHDLPYIAEFALRKQWPSFSEAERARFIAAFEKLSVMTYASRFKNVGAETFKMGGGAAGSDAQGGAASTRAQVQTAIVRPGEPDIPLEYLLQQKDGAWRIINIVADGVSDLALKRAEYQSVLANGTIDALIQHVDAQAARLEQK
jgi:phospholipid transport system substrate-binding protein